LVNGLRPLMTSTDLRRNTIDLTSFIHLSLIALIPDIDDVPSVAYRRVSRHQRHILPALLNAFSSSSNGAITVIRRQCDTTKF
ncbi:hypothetical protein, partial [Pseudomonas syringae]|uniref:hypothetical protein n=1 Tax=Pseudomonas syringae TaxID=317 RepID=UPI001F2CF205